MDKEKRKILLGRVPAAGTKSNKLNLPSTLDRLETWSLRDTSETPEMLPTHVNDVDTPDAAADNAQEDPSPVPPFNAVPFDAESMFDCFIDVLDSNDLEKIKETLADTPEKQREIIDALRLSNEFFAKVTNDFVPTDPRTQDPEKSVLIRETEWMKCKFENFTLKELLEAGSASKHCPRVYPLKGTDGISADHFIVLKLEIQGTKFDAITNALKYAQVAQDKVNFFVGCTSHEKSLQRREKSKEYQSKEFLLLQRSKLLDAIVPDRRRFLLPAYGSKAEVESFPFNAPDSDGMLEMFCNETDLNYGVVVLPDGQHVIMPENHVLADWIKYHAANEQALMKVQAYRLFALQNAPFHPRNEPAYSATLARLKYDYDSAPEEFCTPEFAQALLSNRKYASTGNYIRVKADVFEMAKRIRLGKLQRDERMETPDSFHFTLGCMAEEFYEMDPNVRWGKDSPAMQELFREFTDGSLTQSRTVEFQFRLVYAVRGPPKPVLPEFTGIWGPECNYFVVGISQGVYQGKDQTLPLKDMACLQDADDKKKKKQQPPHDAFTRFMTVPRTALSSHFRIRKKERIQTKNSTKIFKEAIMTDKLTFAKK